MLHVIEYFPKSPKVIRNDTFEKDVSRSLQLCLYLTLFLRHSAVNNGLTLKLGFGVVQGR